MNKALLSLAVALAGTALVVAVVSRRSPVSPGTHEATEASKLAVAEIQQLHDELAALRSAVAELNRLLASAQSANAGARAAATPTKPAEPGSVEARLAEVSATLDQFRSGMVRSGMLPPGSNEVHSMKAVILDPATGVEEKLIALRTLRAADARTDDVVKQMIQAYYSTENAAFRADIFRQLDGVKTPELRAPLLEAVSKAADAGVREEAAETLFHYLPDADVKAWLEHLAANDPNQRVREQAAQSLQPRR